MEYNKEYFIEKFKAIPDNKWICNGDLQNKDNPEIGCALFHCGVRVQGYNYIHTDESLALGKLLSKEKVINEEDYFKIVYRINDGVDLNNTTPKEAIIKALEKLK